MIDVLNTHFLGYTEHGDWDEICFEDTCMDEEGETIFNDIGVLVSEEGETNLKATYALKKMLDNKTEKEIKELADKVISYFSLRGSFFPYNLISQ